MFQNVDIFQTAGAMAKHASERQALVAKNVANADTPGFKAAHIAPFQSSDVARQTTVLRTSRTGHLESFDNAPAGNLISSTAEPSPNGNNVSIEQEMMHSVAISREHNRALAIYQHSLTVLRTAVGR